LAFCELFSAIIFFICMVDLLQVARLVESSY